MAKEKLVIKTGQIWRSKKLNYCIEVGKRIKDGFWYVYPHMKRTRTHSMKECSFHFYELCDDRGLVNDNNA